MKVRIAEQVLTVYRTDQRIPGGFDSRLSRAGFEAKRSAASRDYGREIEELYFREAASVPLLSKERERDLARQIQWGEREIERLRSEFRKAAQRSNPDTETPPRNSAGKLRVSVPDKEGSMNPARNTPSKKQPPSTGRNCLQDMLAELKKREDAVMAARSRMIASNLRLVVRIARIYRNQGLPFMDLVQEGNVGLMKAVSKYDYRKGFRFSTYASWWIRQGITRALAEKSRTIRVPLHIHELKRKVDRTSDQLNQELGRDPLPDEIAEKMGTCLNDVLRAVGLTRRPLSFERLTEQDRDDRDNFVVSEGMVVLEDDLLERIHLKRRICEVFASVKPGEERVIRLRFGIGVPRCHTLDETAGLLGIHWKQAQHMEREALKKLKDQWKVTV